MSSHVFNRILVVCVGNICRSPMADILLQHLLPGGRARVASAGLAAVVGAPIDPLAGAVLAAHGLDASRHRARQLTPALLRDSDLVLAMERDQLERVRTGSPEATGKLFLLDKWGASRDIPDPYRQGRAVFEDVYRSIDQAVRAWLPHL